ncbi:MAG: helicase C-terminal domain-containing protein [Anaerolineales bacterium]
MKIDLPPIVAIDVETTGLDANKDAIIEIGAVRFRGPVVEAEWSTLINPGRPIPAEITHLTGIHNEDVAGAPYLQEVYADLLDFVGNAPILGHNIKFDLGFLRRRGGFLSNPPIDTYEMAAILMPRAGRYKLGALAEALNIDLPATHRALDDARVTHVLFLALFKMAQALPIKILAEIVRQSTQLEWHGYWPFQQALRTYGRQVVQGGTPDAEAPLFRTPAVREYSPLHLPDAPRPLDVEAVAGLLMPGGLFARHMPAFEHRQEQIAMLEVVANAISENRHLMVEAGTGTGKSIAYLLPAALWAYENKTRVVISTNTINLQDQLLHKDIPAIREALGIDLRATVLKGRSNYVCPRRLENLRRHGVENIAELRVLGKVQVWMLQGGNGDRSEINLNGPDERDAWRRISAEDEGCTAETCMKRTGGTCPFYRARQAAQSAHLLIVNHALLLADMAVGNRVLPEYTHVIIDEGHHLEDAITNALSVQITAWDVERLARELGSPSTGLLARLINLGDEILEPSQGAALHHLADQAATAAFSFQNRAKQFFGMLDQFLYEMRSGQSVGAYGQQARILPATRTQPAWLDVETSWEETTRAFRPLDEALKQVVHAASEMAESELEEMEDTFSALSNLYSRIQEIYAAIEELVFKPVSEHIYWVETRASYNNLKINIAPLHTGPLMERYLWHEKDSVIITSATLTAAGEFDYIKSRLSAQDADELTLGSPFDYESSALLYIPKDIPEPADRHGHQCAIEQGLIRLCRATNGRALVLFTSYEQLQRTSRAIRPILERDQINVLEQGEGASSHALLETFRTGAQTVLLGTRAFWEGVDIPGEDLSVLVIVKLPFDVPSDPIIAARSETFEDPFYQYTIPEAILRFRQGFGRLIRTRQDRGVVVILDKRVLTKRYGKLFLESLPECTVRVDSLNNLPNAAAQWLGL